MTTTISEKDKRLLVKLVIGLVIFGILYLVIRPLFEQNMEMAQQIQDEEYVKSDYEMKVKTLLPVKMVTEESQMKLQEVSDMFYPMMTDTEIDFRITSQALKYGLTVKDLGITVPNKEKNTTLTFYSDNVKGIHNNVYSFPGLHTASIVLTVTGDRDSLQDFLDENIKEDIKQRVGSYLWSRQRDGQYGLNLTMELYMCENVEEYLAEKADAAEAETDTEE